MSGSWSQLINALSPGIWNPDAVLVRKRNGARLRPYRVDLRYRQPRLSQPHGGLSQSCCCTYKTAELET
ncbi:Heterokaryon incompatibility protein 6, OR allele [Fusarium oxysporum f. sp. albedinis]|nr:Heterokaryon incompatibility protein 6, OR allele [Fusarium oxysporum f. sp. albedinis]